MTAAGLFNVLSLLVLLGATGLFGLALGALERHAEDEEIDR